jgi:hypothetical protein
MSTAENTERLRGCPGKKLTSRAKACASRKINRQVPDKG